MADYSQLLSWHTAHVRSMGHVEFAAKILRTRSTALNDVLAYIATDDRCTVDELKDIVSAGEFKVLKPRTVWLAALGRVVALQALDDMARDKTSSDLEFGLACLRYANQSLPRNQEHQQFHRLEIELLMMLGQVAQARHLLENNAYLQDYYYGYLISELDHPTYTQDRSNWARWVEGFNRPFVENDLEKIDARSLLQRDYNELSTDKVRIREHGPKVSVIMTSYKPDRHAFLSAVNSILNQSWQNLELIIVDDASPSAFAPILAEAENLDRRVHLIRLATNGGTYRARNAGIVAATGEFLTGQDSDDWSHPQRIEAQVEYLLERPSETGVVVEAIRVDDALHRVFPGRVPHGNCEVSFMLPTELARDVGGYMLARKAADGEFRRRVEKYTGTKVGAIEKPLYLIRIGHQSLSNADFKPGWSHPIRRIFWSSTRHWHENTDGDELRINVEDTSPVPIPTRFKIDQPGGPSHYDVVFVGDWRAYDATQRTMIDEITVLSKLGKRIGIMHLESVMSQSKETTRLCFEVQDMVNKRIISAVVPDEPSTAEMVMIHDPTILQFTEASSIALRASISIIKSDIPPPAINTPDVMFLPPQCDKVARQAFGGAVIWASSDPQITRLLENYESKIAVDRRQWPVILQSERWRHARQRLVNSPPVIGRHSANYESHWPADQSIVSMLWPTDGSSEVRVLGDARSYLRRHTEIRFPMSWLVYRDKEIRPEAFMRGIDFFVYFPSQSYPQGLCREALEAAASGAVVILPEPFRGVHKDGAIYASPEEVPQIISYYTENPSRYCDRVRGVEETMNDFTSEGLFLEYLSNLWVTSRNLVGADPHA